MTTLKRIDLTCPNCDRRFSSDAVDLLETMGRKRTDFQFATAGLPQEIYGVHLCDGCGFAGPEAWFTESAGVSSEIRRHVHDELTPRLGHGTIAPSEKWEFAAKVATWDAAPDRQVADLWLRAAWCCVDEGDTEAERYYRRRAARSFEEALATTHGVEPRDRAVITYLIGELWRRIGESARANAWFDAVEGEVINRYTQRWIAQAAKRQHTAPQEWFS